jgi:hypothetical protein
MTTSADDKTAGLDPLPLTTSAPNPDQIKKNSFVAFVAFVLSCPLRAFVITGADTS